MRTDIQLLGIVVAAASEVLDCTPEWDLHDALECLALQRSSSAQAGVQGDVRFAEVMELMGATVEWEANAITITGPRGGKLTAIDHNCNDIPDAAMTAAVAALFADGCAPGRLIA
jgi:5-enolpyruvylshikimate-3-phosphate synthase